MWRDLCSTQYAISGGALFLKAEYMPGVTAFAPPRSPGVAPETLIDPIVEYCRENGLPPRLCAVSGSFHMAVRRLFPDARERTDQAWSDYLYNAEDLVTLAGRRYSGQRNHINKFMRLYPEWRFEAVDGRNLAKVRAFFDSYSREHTKDYEAYEEGNRKAIEVIDNLEKYRQVGGVLFAGDEVAGAAFGETVGDTLFVHTEKALTEFQGSYPMLVNQFAQTFATADGIRVDPEGIKYINREEDDGVEGLRTSKLSYHPCALLEKYIVEL
jgi:hypothetical protein